MYTLPITSNHVRAPRGLVEPHGRVQRLGRQREGLHRHARRLQAEPARPRHDVHTACSTSLVAVAQACKSLRAGQCDMALAGGVSITVPPRSGYLYQEGACCRPTATRAPSTQGERHGLQRRRGHRGAEAPADALADGDTIYAVIRGAAVNNDGGDKASFMAPSVDGPGGGDRTRRRRWPGVEPRTIGYVEAHGTGTPLGDPIEVEAPHAGLPGRRPADRGFCALGSVKTNIGHLESAAGAPASSRRCSPCTRRDLRRACTSSGRTRDRPRASPFFVNRSCGRGRRGRRPRRAGVSSFGVGGTNAHVVLEEPPAVRRPAPRRRAHLLVLSARTRRRSLQPPPAPRDLLRRPPGRRPGRRGLHAPARAAGLRPPRAWSARTATTPAALGANDRAPAASRAAGAARAGGGVPVPRPGRAEPEDGARTCTRTSPLPRGDRPLRRGRAAGARARPARAAVLSGGDGRGRRRRGAHSRPDSRSRRMFAVEYALASCWQSWGVGPEAMLGHSVGEYVAAVAGRRWSPSRRPAPRGRRAGGSMQACPPGSMLGGERLSGRVHGHGCTSGSRWPRSTAPSLCVVSGPDGRGRGLQQGAGGRGIAARRLQTSHAFHSA